MHFYSALILKAQLEKYCNKDTLFGNNIYILNVYCNIFQLWRRKHVNISYHSHLCYYNEW